MQYRDCIVVVTGGNSGVGRPFVDRFVSEGPRVIACGRDEVSLQALKADQPSVEVRHCDITSRSEVEALEAFMAQKYGRLDLLINNSAVMEQVDVLAGNVEDAAIAREIETNLTAPILLTRRFLPLLKSSRSPLILMATSGYALLPARRAPTCSATKAGLRSFTGELCYQLANIRVVETLPPLVDTRITAANKRPKRTPAAVMDETLRAIARARAEIFAGQVRWLPLLMRIAPRYGARRVANLSSVDEEG